MDDRFYLAVYAEEHRKICLNLMDRLIKEEEIAGAGPADKKRFGADRYVCDVVIPGYERCQTGSQQGVCRSRFSEVTASLYELDEHMLPFLDEAMGSGLIRHSAMAADEERLYNVYVYVSEENTDTCDKGNA